MNYKKDKSYIKQRLEYVSPVDYIIELENKIDNLQQENEILNNRINKAIEEIKTREDYEIRFKKLLNILNGGDEE